MTRKFELGQKVYFLHPQSHLRPYTIIDGIISSIRKIVISTTYLDEFLKKLEGESIKYEYEVKLTPSGTKINVKEEDIYSELCCLKCKTEERVSLEKTKLKLEAEKLAVNIDIN